MDMHKIMSKKMKEIKNQKENEIREVSLSLLKENPYQPRIEIKPDEVKDLANSIKEKGLLQPILVAEADTGYYIIAGHRRVEAHKWLGKEKIKARIIKADNENLASISLIENLQREDLDLIETAMALKKYKNEFNKTLDEIGREIGKTKSYVSQILNILNLPDKIINDIKENKTTKDITALNLLNSYAKKKFSMLNKSQNTQETDDLKGAISQKWKNEVFELYQGFLKNGREWLKSEIKKRLENSKPQPDYIQIKITKKNGITIKIKDYINKDKLDSFKKELKFLVDKYKKDI